MITYWQGYKIDHSKRVHRIGYWLLNLREALKRSPRDFRYWFADQLSRVAMLLRGEKVSVFGYYDAAKGNRASILAEDIRINLICKNSPHFGEDYQESCDKLEELASLASATWESNL
jgi:hypothetical protein